jgi:hypothetical protein
VRPSRIALVAIASLLALAALAEARATPPPLIARADHHLVRAASGSFCWSDRGSGLCADYGYPLRIRSRLPVKGGARIALRIGAPARRVLATLVRVTGDQIQFLDPAVRESPINVRRRRWWVRLPPDLMGANVLDVSIKYARKGDADFWVGLRTGGVAH